MSLEIQCFFVCEIKGTITDDSVCSNNIILNRLLLVVASALVPLFSGFDRLGCGLVCLIIYGG